MTRAARAGTAYVLVAVIALLAPLAVLGVWAQQHVISTQGYVDTVGPLADDLRVQQAVTTAVTDAVIAAVPTKQLLAGLPTNLVSGLPGAAATERAAARALVQATVDQVVKSASFADLWRAGNRTAQTQILAVLDNGTQVTDLAVNLNAVAETVRVDLVARGFTGLATVRFDGASANAGVDFPLGDLHTVSHRWHQVRWVSRWLAPLLALLAVVALALAPHRRQFVVILALAVLAAVGVAALVGGVAHHAYNQQLATGTAAAAGRAVGDVLFGTLSRLIRILAISTFALAVTAGVTLLIPTRRAGGRA